MTTFTYTVVCTAGVAGQITNSTCTLAPAGNILDGDTISFLFTDTSGAPIGPSACVMSICASQGSPASEKVEPFVGFSGQTSIEMIVNTASQPNTAPLVVKGSNGSVTGSWTFTLSFIVNGFTYFLDPIIIIKPV